MRTQLVFSLMALAIAAASPATAEIAKARVTGGEIAGTVVDGLSEFKGIPFAAPPTGALRWKAPQPVKPWSGVRQTVQFGPACMQTGGGGGAGPGIPYSEDCLYIDVWTPAKSPGEKLPVIAWIYGGAFAAGATSNPLYDGTNFAKKGVVFVSISYRVGPFGFLATPELSRESGHGSGAYGLLDMIAGLKWIQANVSKFGGDPGKVTILGHSAGGWGVSMLAASPLAKGLFRGVISESGANFTPPQDSPWAGTTLQTLRMAEQGGQGFLEKLGVHTLAEARALPADKVLAGVRGGGVRFWPPLDGYVNRGDQFLLWKQGRFNDTPIMVGDVSDEGAAFGVRKTTAAAFEEQVRKDYGKSAEAILAAYPHATDEEATRASTELASDTTFDWGQFTWAREQTTYGKGNVHVFWFDKPTERDPNGSPHGSEVAYVFGNLGIGGRSQPTADDRALSDQMQTYWVNFAKSLDPNGAGLPTWPAFTAADPVVMRFGRDAGAAPDPIQTRLKVLDGYYDWRRDGSH